MDIEFLWLILYIISILVMLGCGKSKKDAPLVALGTIMILVTGYGLLVGYPSVYGTNSIFASVTGILSLFGVVRVINALF